MILNEVENHCCCCYCCCYDFAIVHFVAKSEYPEFELQVVEVGRLNRLNRCEVVGDVGCYLREVGYDENEGAQFPFAEHQLARFGWCFYPHPCLDLAGSDQSPFGASGSFDLRSSDDVDRQVLYVFEVWGHVTRTDEKSTTSRREKRGKLSQE